MNHKVHKGSQRFAVLLLTIALSTARAQDPRPSSQTNSPSSAPAYLGFDRNDYPGDDTLKSLRKTFSYAGYWLNNPPNVSTNTWIGKRSKVQSADFGFLVLYNGRLFKELKSVSYAMKLGVSDAQAAVAAARREGFPKQTIVFLDQEQGGRMLPEQKAYIYAWVDEVAAADFAAGIYCSGISAAKQGGEDVVTAEDIRQSAGSRKIAYWVTNDACPPSGGCVFAKHALPTNAHNPAGSGIPFADVWQFAQSPKRRDVAAGCSGYHSDGNCYPPNIDAAKGLHVDLNAASSPDPSHGRDR
jgi:glycoside hydrolase-like protein